jgi:hypothetical protein
VKSPLIEIAETALRYWGGDITRETASALLPTWRHADALTDDERAELLSRFVPDEPVLVPGLDYLPTFTAGTAGGL